MATYGSYQGVLARIRHMTPDAVRSITAEQLETWLAERSALLNARLVRAGYTLPVEQEDALAILGRFANVGAAADAELAQRFAGDTGEEGNRRYEALLAEWNTFDAYLDDLAALGVPQTGTGDDVAYSEVPVTYGGGNTPDEFARC